MIMDAYDHAIIIMYHCHYRCYSGAAQASHLCSLQPWDACLTLIFACRERHSCHYNHAIEHAVYHYTMPLYHAACSCHMAWYIAWYMAWYIAWHGIWHDIWHGRWHGIWYGKCICYGHGNISQVLPWANIATDMLSQHGYRSAWLVTSLGHQPRRDWWPL